jgi:hypothetical protein
MLFGSKEQILLSASFKAGPLGRMLTLVTTPALIASKMPAFLTHQRPNHLHSQ